MNKNFRLLTLEKIALGAGILTKLVEDSLGKKDNPKFVALPSVGPGTTVFMSENAVKSDGSVDIIINFRGIVGQAKDVFSKTNGANAVVVTAEGQGPKEENLGSKLLQQQFGNANKVNEIVGTILTHLQKQFPDKKIKRGKLVLSGFSGGGSVVADLVAQKNQIKGGIDGLIINDGLHSKPGSESLKAVVDFAREATKDPNKKFKIMHTAIKPWSKNLGYYTSTTETADYILNQLGLERKPGQNTEYGFTPASEAKAGGVEIIQMYDKPAPYYADNRPGSLGDQHIQSLEKGHPYLFRDIL